MGTKELLGLAVQQLRLGDLERAEQVLSKVIRRDPSASKAYELLAHIAGRRGDLQTSETHLLKASTFRECTPEALFQLGELQLHRGQAQAAIAVFNRVLRIVGDRFEPLHELGVAYSGLGEFHRALQFFERAEKENAQPPVLHYNIGRVLTFLGQHTRAIARFNEALTREPTMERALRDRGLALSDIGDWAEALTDFDRAIALGPLDLESWLGRASVLASQGRTNEARACYEQLAKLPADTGYEFGYWVRNRSELCRWNWWPEALDELLVRVRRGEQAIVPFYLLALPCTAEEQFRCARTYAQDQCPPGNAATPTSKRRTGGRIRVGYFSTDFHDHAVSQLLAGVIERHDRKAFEWHGYALALPVPDHMTERLKRAFDRFIVVSDRSDADVAALARANGLDIAIDLNGFTAGSRPNIFAQRAAPIQVSYLGFAGTMGCDFMDYIIADATTIRPEDYEHYSEKVVVLAGCYQPNDNTKIISETESSRESHGLPSGGFVFACFNNCYKITPDVFDIWMRVLRRVPHSVLWLPDSSSAVRTSLCQEAERRGIDSARLVWAVRLPFPAHLEKHRHADLFLDTLPYTGHTTCSDALWAGLPVLTVEGTTFVSRVASSLLRAAGLPELVAPDTASYEERAVALATGESPLLASLRGRLANERGHVRLFDTARHAAVLEAAFRIMVERLEKGLPPDHLHVS